MHDCGLNTIFAISETWLNDKDDSLLWNVLNDTHVMFRNDRVPENNKKGKRKKEPVLPYMYRKALHLKNSSSKLKF